MNEFKQPDSSGKQDISAKSAKKKPGAGKFLHRILSGEYLAREGMVKHMPFIAFLAVLFILNIGLVYYFENTQRKKHTLQKELNELRSQYNTTLSDLEKSKQQSNVAQAISEMGLHELRTPPQIIDVEPSFFEKQ